MKPENFEGRRFGDAHQAQFLAQWSGGVVVPDGSAIRLPGGLILAQPGNWIIRAADGTVQVQPGGNMNGWCADCGEPVWWNSDGRLVTRDGIRWCYGPGRSRLAMDHWHALPGMDQYIVPAPEGQPCQCLARPELHIHLIVLAGRAYCQDGCDHETVPVPGKGDH